MRKRAFVVLAAAASCASMLAVPDLAGASAGPAMVAGEEAAVVTARRTGQRVEVAALRTQTQQVFADPSGALTMEQYAQPVRVRRASGWVPVDTTLERRSDGTIAPRAVAVDLAFSAGGPAVPLVRIGREGKELALGWAGRLPVPDLAGDTATYRDVLPGIDLVVVAGVLGVAEVLVVRTPAAARHPALSSVRFTTRTAALSVRTDAAGNVDLVDGAGVPAFHGGTPIMWDSGGGVGAAGVAEIRQRLRGPTSGARHSAMRVDVTAGELSVRPDVALLTSSETRFPVFLDPGLSWAGSPSRQAWTLVRKAYPNSSYYNSSEVARVGHETDTGMTDRSLFRMSTSAVRAKHILKGTFRANETWAWSCSARPVELWRTGSIGTSTTWNNQPTWAKRQDTKNVAKGYSASCPAGGVEFNATEAASYAAGHNLSSITLGLRSPNESDPYYWKKFSNNPVLTIVYNTVPQAPSALSIDPGLPCVTGSGRPVVGTATPILRAKLTDPDGTAQELLPDYGMTTLAGTAVTLPQPTAKVRSGTNYAYTVPAGKLVSNTTYRWRVRTYDTVEYGAWSVWCEFTVDTTRPQSVPVVASADYPETLPGQNPILAGDVGMPGTFRFTPGPGDTDIASYRYSVNTNPPTTAVTAAADMSATVVITPVQADLNTLYVRAADRAGNLSDIKGYDFYVRPPAPAIGWWTLDDGFGDVALEDNGQYDLALGGGAGWATGRYGSALSFNGSTAYAQSAGPVLSTDASFSVSAWVRLTDATRNRTAVSQDGTRNSGFQLRYADASDRWALSMPTTDTDTEVNHAALSLAAPTVGAWTHLVGVYDAAAGQLRLYVNGTLQTMAIHSGAWRAGGPLLLGRGKLHGTLGDFWSGEIDQVRVWQRAITQNEVTLLAGEPADSDAPADAPLPVRPAGVDSYWADLGAGYWNLDQKLTIYGYTAGSQLRWAHEVGFVDRADAGYVALEVDGTAKWAVWSVRGADGGLGTDCVPTEENGVGYTCRVALGWLTGRTYTLRVWTLSTDAGGEWWGAWVIDTTTGAETFIGQLHVPHNQRLESKAASTEYFGPDLASCAGSPQAKAIWKLPTGNNGAVRASTAESYPTDGTACPGTARVATVPGGTLQELGATPLYSGCSATTGEHYVVTPGSSPAAGTKYVEIGAWSLDQKAPAQIWQPNTGSPPNTNQRWRLACQSDGTWVLVNVNSGKCLDKPLGAVDGTDVYQYTCHYGDNQRWWHDYRGTDAYGRDYWALVNKHDLRCLAIEGPSWTNGAKVHVWPCKDSWAELFWFW